MRVITLINDIVDLSIILLERALQGSGDAQWGERSVAMYSKYFLMLKANNTSGILFYGFERR
jgi:hypothetical protein